MDNRHITTFDNLPSEVLLAIAGKLSLFDIPAISRLSRKLRDITQEKSFWQAKSDQYFPKLDPTYDHFLYHHPEETGAATFKRRFLEKFQRFNISLNYELAKPNELEIIPKNKWITKFAILLIENDIDRLISLEVGDRENIKLGYSVTFEQRRFGHIEPFFIPSLYKLILSINNQPILNQIYQKLWAQGGISLSNWAIICSQPIKEINDEMDLMTGENYLGLATLHLAIKKNNVALARLILSDPRCNVNVLARRRKTALHLAASSGNVELVNLLLDDPQINPLIEDNRGFIPFCAAVKNRHFAVQMLFFNIALFQVLIG